MAAAVAPIFSISDRVSPFVLKSPAGWIGSKAGLHNDFCFFDANGFIDEAAAAGAVISAKRLGLLGQDIGSGVAAASAEALAMQVRIPGDNTQVEMSLLTSGSSFTTLVTPANTNIGDPMGVARRSTGEYCWDTTGTDMGVIQGVNVARGTVTGTILPAQRLK